MSRRGRLTRWSRRELGVTIIGLHRKAPPLHGSHSSFDDQAPDLPLRDDLPALRAPETAVPAIPPVIAPSSSNLSLWLVAAVALVTGIVIGFLSGYEAGRRPSSALFTDAGVVAADEQPSETLTTGQTFTEDAVAEPVRVDPEPIVPEPAATEPQRPAPQTAPEPPRRRDPPVERASSGPGSLQVVSRPSGAQVVLDGRSIGRTPLVVPGVSAGSHDVRLELPGFRRWATSVQVAPGTRTRVAASLEQ